jgi:hypothetical protein
LKLVNPAKSPLSIKANFAPFAASAAADTAPLMPPSDDQYIEGFFW